MNREWNVLTQRLESVERELRRWKLVGSLGLVGLAAVILVGQARPSTPVGRVIEAERFVLRSASGEALAVLGVESDPSLVAGPSPTSLLTFYDRGGTARASVGGSGVALFDLSGRRRGPVLQCRPPGGA